MYEELKCYLKEFVNNPNRLCQAPGRLCKQCPANGMDHNPGEKDKIIETIKAYLGECYSEDLFVKKSKGMRY